VARFELVVRPSVLKDTKDIPAAVMKKILQRMEGLRENPRPPGCVKLAGMEYYRIRQGNYRIIYEIVDQQLIVVVVKVAHRRDVYR